MTKNNTFFLQDIGSTTGTFIKIDEPMELKEKMIIEIGSYQLQVKKINMKINGDNIIDEENSHIILEIYESPEESNERTFMLSNESSIGRKNNNTLSFSEDLHMSNLHCKINLIGNKFIFEDMASTNGSWLRLSLEGNRSDPYQLKDETIFKIGNSAMYQVSFPQKPKNINAEMNTIISKDTNNNNGDNAKCVICWENEKDCLIMPCRHNASCIKCTKVLKNCPICRNPLKNIIRIYKS
jgi:predicted component of type VI protein secretion system